MFTFDVFFRSFVPKIVLQKSVKALTSEFKTNRQETQSHRKMSNFGIDLLLESQKHNIK